MAQGIKGSTPICTATEDCTNPQDSHGWCAMHRSRFARHWSFDDPRPTLAERVWACVDKSAGADACWPWTGTTNGRYGRLSVKGKQRPAHQLVYELVHGPIPAHLTDIDHLCRNPPCCNPAHLEAVTHRENMARGHWAVKTHCKQGHEFTDDNTRRNKRTGARICLTCQKAAMARFLERRAATPS